MIPPPPISPLFPYTTLFRSLASNSPIVILRRSFCAEKSNGQSTQAGRECPDHDQQEHQSRCRAAWVDWPFDFSRSEEHTSELQSHSDLVCRLLLEKKKIEKK